jgi:plastocyanin
MTTHDESHIIRTSPKRMAQGLAIVVGVLVFGAIILVTNWNNMVKVPPPVSSIALQPPGAGTTTETQGTPTTTTTTETPTTETTTSEGGGGGGGGANAPVAGVTINIAMGASVQGSPDYNPDAAEVPMNEKIVWVNQDTSPHTATSGTGAEDPNSGQVFDTSIINGGESSAPQELKGVKEGDEVPYYCAVHPYMTSKLTVTAASAGSGATATEGNATNTETSPATTNATTTTAGTGGAATPPSTPAATTTTTTAAATLTIPTGAATPGNPAYEPASLTVKKGDAIDVVNKDSSPHTVTSGTGVEDPNAGKMFDTSIINAAGSAQIATADLEAGEYDFHCAVHPFMTGKIIVQ